MHFIALLRCNSFKCWILTIKKCIYSSPPATIMYSSYLIHFISQQKAKTKQLHPKQNIIHLLLTRLRWSFTSFLSTSAAVGTHSGPWLCLCCDHPLEALSSLVATRGLHPQKDVAASLSFPRTLQPQRVPVGPPVLLCPLAAPEETARWYWIRKADGFSVTDTDFINCFLQSDKFHFDAHFRTEYERN